MSAITGHHERIEREGGRRRGGPGGLLAALFGPAMVAWQHRSLIGRMTRQEIQARYRNSALGLVWAVITPLMMLGVYTFVFAVVLKARWGVVGSDAGGTAAFAVQVFLGLIVFQLLASVMTQAPGLLKRNRSLVKKVVFPLEALVVIRSCVAMFDFAAGFLVFLALGWIIGDGIGWGVLLVPVAAVSVVFLGVGVGWLLAGVGAYLDDLEPIAATAATLVLFMSAVFYPPEIVPASWSWVMEFNPVAAAIDTARGLIADPVRLDLARFGLLLAVSWAAALVGLGVFRRLRAGFADVL